VKRGASEARAAQRIEALAKRWDLSVRVAERLLELLRLLRDDPRASTSVRDPAEAVDVHVADSLTALPWLDSRAARRVADIGSGAGLPGLPLALARPDLAVDLVESGRRKCQFLSDAAQRLGASRVRVLGHRVEEWAAGEGGGRYDTVLARAVGTLAELLEYAAPLLECGGALIAWKGARDPAEEHRAGRAAEVVGMRIVEVERVEPYPGSRAHNLYLYEKVRVTPDGYPRRPGMARKHPLG